MKGFFLMLVSGLCVLSFQGCGFLGGTVAEGPAIGKKITSKDSPDGVIRMNSVALLDKSLQRFYLYEELPEGYKEYGKSGKLSVESTGARRTPTGTLEVWALIRNRTDHQLQLEGRAFFFDKDQAPVEGPTVWQPLVLSPKGTVSYNEFSVDIARTANYYIELRERR